MKRIVGILGALVLGLFLLVPSSDGRRSVGRPAGLSHVRQP